MSLLETAIQAARAGGKTLRVRATQPRQVTRKGFRDFVTDADLAAQSAIFSVIQSAYPSHAILSEESAEAKHLDQWVTPRGHWWIIDPLDGTTNFQLGSPTYAVSIACAEGDTLVAAALYDPNREMLFAASLGQGATLNGATLQVSDRTDLIEAVASSDWPRSPGLRKQAFEVAGRFGNACRTFRSIGCASLGIASVGAGWTDIYVHQSILPWDCGAAALIVREAGGLVLRHNGQPWTLRDPDFLAVTPALRDAAVGLLRD
jgi:myo-inositol-1(or 4)-monophosphatase